ncbi:hypothetical protein CON07_09160 [Bacillus sp. AFS094611]|uniref:Group-Specific protein n=3 Tax=Bacillaceae TaxID=186817 RepID=A0A2A7D2X7_BACAN|nr:hypothetical protein BK707_29770 [Bacillus thuringiensis serovar coreanensis]OTX49132.1 hypothetical protein BK724_06520 [Bacillus thuringiensis serovar sooncheon]OTX57691.1 hypothetical protein BK725_07960 [Bacillus thuringiensis serovar guiyangiensis]OTX62654.1 hypothetical protein BK727_28960 [Bacillus thuringiensis serovar roskildiensis]PDZ14299.1 hypothetical protein CON16_25325 [Bacillus anthracis]PDZ51773.1 hypothetical protein CON07_09160 [Bacillus sp. AFS094611]
MLTKAILRHSECKVGGRERMFDEDGIVLIMEPADERNLRRFILSVPKSVYEKKGLTLQYGAAIGQGYMDIIEDIISVHIEIDVVTIIGHVRS